MSASWEELRYISWYIPKYCLHSCICWQHSRSQIHCPFYGFILLSPVLHKYLWWELRNLHTQCYTNYTKLGSVQFSITNTLNLQRHTCPATRAWISWPFNAHLTDYLGIINNLQPCNSHSNPNLCRCTQNEYARVERGERTLTMLSAYFITQDTRRPVQPRFNTTSHVVTLYPTSNLDHQAPFSYAPRMSSIVKWIMLNSTPNLQGNPTHPKLWIRQKNCFGNLHLGHNPKVNRFFSKFYIITTSPVSSCFIVSTWECGGQYAT